MLLAVDMVHGVHYVAGLYKDRLEVGRVEANFIELIE